MCSVNKVSKDDVHVNNINTLTTALLYHVLDKYILIRAWKKKLKFNQGTISWFPPAVVLYLTRTFINIIMSRNTKTVM